jgi:hypothetical protein
MGTRPTRNTSRRFIPNLLSKHTWHSQSEGLDPIMGVDHGLFTYVESVALCVH